MVITIMAAFEPNKLDRPEQQKRCPSIGSHGGCGHCSGAMDEANHEEPLKLGQVLLVFFLPLICAVTLVIGAVSYFPRLAEHPGYLALSALAVASSAIFLARIFTRRSKTPKRG